MAKFAENLFRDCLKIPERPRSGLLRVFKMDLEAPFRHHEAPLTRTFGSPLAIYQRVSRETVRKGWEEPEA